MKIKDEVIGVKISDLEKIESFRVYATGNTESVITGLYCSDLLSWVMAKGKTGNAWITVQTHQNVLAVASLLEFSCVILPDGLTMEPLVLQKAVEENIAVVGSDLDAYGIFQILYEAGLK